VIFACVDDVPMLGNIPNKEYYKYYNDFTFLDE
jgi:hypothetical protein